MGEVYRAHDQRLDRDVALKVLSTETLSDETSRKRFRKEALALSKLNHPNIATIFDYNTQSGVDFLVMEYIVGNTLSQRLNAGPLTEKQAFDFARQIAAALEEAHARGVVHRDLKPANIMLTPNAQAKVLDFGLAKSIQPAAETTGQALTSQNAIVGTLRYMAPEQLRGEKVDERTDIYSLGLVLYEMCTGHRAVPEVGSAAIIGATLHKTPTSPRELKPELSPGLERVIVRCLEKEPDKRYQSSADLLAVLNGLTSGSDVRTEMTRLLPTKSLLKPRAVKALGAGLFVLLAILIGVNLGTLRGWFGGGTNPRIESIVVLPCTVYGPDEDRFLTDAIPNALSTRLSQVEGIETKAPPTSVDFERIGGDSPRIAQIYGVNGYILTTVNSTTSDRLVLQVQLVETTNRRVKWGREYPGRRGDYLQIAHNAAEGLRQALRPEGAAIKPNAGPTQSTEAELAYQRGLYHLNAYNNAKRLVDFERSLSDLNRALELDPAMARAAAGIAQLHATKLYAGAPPDEQVLEIEKWALQALDLDHHCGEGWQALSVAEEFRKNGDKQKRLEYALRSAKYAGYSGYVHATLGAALSGGLALEALTEASRQDPVYVSPSIAAAGVLSMRGKTDEGLVLLDSVLSIAPEMPSAMAMKSLLMLRGRRLDEAEQLVKRLEALPPGRLNPGLVGFARDWLEYEKFLERGQDKERETASLARLVALARGQGTLFPRWQTVTVSVVALQAKHDSTKATLETLCRRAATGIYDSYDWLMLTPELAAVRKDPGFNKCISRSRDDFERMLRTLEQAGRDGELPSYLEKPVAEARAFSAAASTR